MYRPTDKHKRWGPRPRFRLEPPPTQLQSPLSSTPVSHDRVYSWTDCRLQWVEILGFCVHVVESSRVFLQPIRGIEGSDYINASFIDVSCHAVQ